MASQVELAAQGIAAALAPSPKSPQPSWRWATVNANNNDGTLSVLVGSTDPADAIDVQATTAAAGASAGDRVRIMWLGASAVADAVLSGGAEREVIYESTTWTVLRDGATIMVQAHGVTATPSTTTALLSEVLADYKPTYNASAAILTNSGGSTQAARLVVYASNGSVYIVPAGYSSSASWYGTLVYICDVSGTGMRRAAGEEF